MKKCERKTLCASTTNTALLNAQHNKLHIHKNDHRLNGRNGFYKSGFTLLVLEHPLGDVRRRLQRQESLECNESILCPTGRNQLKHITCASIEQYLVLLRLQKD